MMMKERGGGGIIVMALMAQVVPVVVVLVSKENACSQVVSVEKIRPHTRDASAVAGDACSASSVSLFHSRKK